MTEVFENPDRRLGVLVPDASDGVIASDQFAPVWIRQLRAAAHEDRFEIEIVFGGALGEVPVHAVHVGGGNDPSSGNAVLLEDHGVVVNRSARHSVAVDEAGNSVEKIAEEHHDGRRAVPVDLDDRLIEIAVDGRTATVIWELDSNQVSESGGPVGRWKFGIAARAETEQGLLESDAVLTYADGGWDF